jgi:hypothetical protein
MTLAATTARATDLALAAFDTPMPELVKEWVGPASVRHYHLKGEAFTLCDAHSTTGEGEPGYSTTCPTCKHVKRSMHATRRIEAQARAREAARKAELETLFDAAFVEEAGPAHPSDIDDAVLSRQLKRRANTIEQDGDREAAYYLREAARRIDLIYGYKEPHNGN